MRSIEDTLAEIAEMIEEEEDLLEQADAQEDIDVLIRNHARGALEALRTLHIWILEL